jgi:hypothetical protein
LSVVACAVTPADGTRANKVRTNAARQTERGKTILLFTGAFLALFGV